MPTILRSDGFDFFFYANEHLPRHVHVKKGNAYGKIDLESMRIVSSTFKTADERKMLDIAWLNRSAMMEAWNEYFRAR